MNINKTKYWTICFPDEFGLPRQETYDEDRIILEFMETWSKKMTIMGRDKFISRENCIRDWVVINFAFETDFFGNKI